MMLYRHTLCYFTRDELQRSQTQCEIRYLLFLRMLAKLYSRSQQHLSMFSDLYWKIAYIFQYVVATGFQNSLISDGIIIRYIFVRNTIYLTCDESMLCSFSTSSLRCDWVCLKITLQSTKRMSAAASSSSRYLLTQNHFKCELSKDGTKWFFESP